MIQIRIYERLNKKTQFGAHKNHSKFYKGKETMSLLENTISYQSYDNNIQLIYESFHP